MLKVKRREFFPDALHVHACFSMVSSHLPLSTLMSAGQSDMNTLYVISQAFCIQIRTA